MRALQTEEKERRGQTDPYHIVNDMG